MLYMETYEKLLQEEQKLYERKHVLHRRKNSCIILEKSSAQDTSYPQDERFFFSTSEMISSSSTIKIRYIVIPSLCSTHCLLLSANAAGNSIHLKSTQESLSDKMCECKFDTLHKKSHISGEYTHGLLSFFIPVSFSQFASMYAIPVLAGRNRHV